MDRGKDPDRGSDQATRKKSPDPRTETPPTSPAEEEISSTSPRSLPRTGHSSLAPSSQEGQEIQEIVITKDTDVSEVTTATSPTKTTSTSTSTTGKETSTEGTGNPDPKEGVSQDILQQENIKRESSQKGTENSAPRVQILQNEPSHELSQQENLTECRSRRGSFKETQRNFA